MCEIYIILLDSKIIFFNIHNEHNSCKTMIKEINQSVIIELNTKQTKEIKGEMLFYKDFFQLFE